MCVNWRELQIEDLRDTISFYLYDNSGAACKASRMGDTCASGGESSLISKANAAESHSKRPW